MNYFDPKSAAERYAKGRPNFHSEVIKRIRDLLKIGKKLDKALDVACGTGLSTRALLEIAENIWGTDVSSEMLNFAPSHKRINYTIAKAENLPFPANCFDLITVGLGVHWFQIDEFLNEAHRLLKTRCWLVLYNNYFISEMKNTAEFTDWFPTVYLPKFPSPPRNRAYNWSNENLSQKGFTLVKEENFKNPVTFSKQQLVIYFTTQSNVISAVENGLSTYHEVKEWLAEELSLFFPNDGTTQTINFGNNVKYIQKM